MKKHHNKGNNGFGKIFFYIILGIVIAVGLFYLYLALTK